MNKNTLPIIFMLAVILLGAGCNKAGKLSQPSTFKPPTGPVELQQKWPVGEHIVKRIDSKMNMETTLPNQSAPMKQDMTMGQKYGLTVLSLDADGGPQVELEFLSVSMKMMQGGKAMLDYDSDNKPADGTGNPAVAGLQKMFQNIIGAKLNFFLDATNGIERVEGVDALISRLTAGGPNAAAAGIKNMFGEGYLKQMIGDSHFLPSQPAQPGDTWPVQEDLNMGALGTLMMSNTVTFVSWEKHGERECARLEFDGTLKSKTSPDSTSKGMTMNIDGGTMSGVSWFDPELGMIIESDVNQDLSMTMVFPVKAQGKTPSQTIKTAMHQALTSKLDSVK